MMRDRYWANSKLANWIRGSTKPRAETWQGWRDWEENAKKSHPIRYWIAEEFLGAVQDFVNWPADKFHKIKYYINNSWVSKTHAMTSNLPRGQWHEFETRLLHCMFDELVNFVEIESAWHHTLWNEEARKQFAAPWYAHGFWRCWRTWRSPEAGIASLEWQVKLVMDSGYGVQPGHPDYGKPTPQAIAAQETLDLYNWWKHERPCRRDVYEASGWSDLTRNTDIFDDHLSQAQQDARTKSMEIMDTLEKRYEREDEEMMIRLIKVRQSLWT